MMTVRLAGAPVSWGVDFTDAPGNPPPDLVLDGIAAAGLQWLELGPAGYLPSDGDALARRGLASVGTFVFEALHSPHELGRAIEATDAALAAIDSLGGAMLVLVDRPHGERAATAGRTREARRMTRGAVRAMADAVRRIATRAGERGVRAVVHPHAGSRIEFVDEIDRLLELVPESEAGLCLDTGHALYAGADPSELLSRYGGRVEHLHLKDVAPQRLRVVHQRRLDFWSAVASGVFCPVGDGSIDLDALARAVDAIRYAGFATIEQDRRPGTPGRPEADLRSSVERLAGHAPFAVR